MCMHLSLLEAEEIVPTIKAINIDPLLLQTAEEAERERQRRELKEQNMVLKLIFYAY